MEKEEWKEVVGGGLVNSLVDHLLEPGLVLPHLPGGRRAVGHLPLVGGQLLRHLGHPSLLQQPVVLHHAPGGGVGKGGGAGEGED